MCQNGMKNLACIMDYTDPFKPIRKKIKFNLRKALSF